MWRATVSPEPSWMSGREYHRVGLVTLAEAMSDDVAARAHRGARRALNFNPPVWTDDVDVAFDSLGMTLSGLRVKAHASRIRPRVSHT
jgi:hypothetical protein